ncbi:MAG: choice-of-anchor B family protein [Putridiphycobacter sp.]|nr:choice-of-anchor B family protein [Putridiphycobacter sp.]
MKYFLIIFFSFPAWSQQYFNVELRSQWSDTTITEGPGNVRFSDVWGFEYKNSNYAVLGSTDGTHFLRIENNSIKPIQFEKGAFSGSLVQHRDFKRYKNYIYGVCDEGSSTLQIFDMRYLPDSVHKVYDSNELFTTCHNLFIDTVKAKLYACGPDNVGMKIYDLQEPESPVLWYTFNNVSYVHDCFVSNDTAFLNAGADGLKVYDFSNNVTPIEIGVLSLYQDKGYNHSGWMDPTKSMYCFIDETLGKKIKLCSLKNGIDNIEVNALFGTRNAVDYIPHNIIVHSGYAFVSYYNEGFRIFDLEQSPIKQVGFYDTYPETNSFKMHGAWGVYVFEKDELILVSDRQSGLFSFYFPFKAFRNRNTDHQVYGTPFVNAESKIIIGAENNENLRFNVFSVAGSIVYESEVMRNWVNIPLDLNPGEYIYQIFSEVGEISYSGKFIIL